MSRSLRSLSAEERASIVQCIHAEADAEHWHSLSNQRKAQLYKKWESHYELDHAAIKDGIMKGFDAAQHIPPSGEAAVHSSLLTDLNASGVPHVRSKVRRHSWRREVDFVLGFSPSFLTHIAELEPAPGWQTGLQQALLYKSLYYQETDIQALPTLILFGDVSSARWSLIDTVCLDQRALLVTYDLFVDGHPAPRNILDLVRGPASTEWGA